MARLSRPINRHTHTIVVIDDDRGLAESLRSILRRDGHDVTACTDPVLGVEQVRQLRPQLILLDYLMPGMTGAEVVRRVREFDQLAQILLVTGYAEEQPGRKLLAELDIQGYHDKADGAERLLVLVDSALKYYRAIKRLDDQRGALAGVVEAAPVLTRLQPAHELFQVALDRLLGLVDGSGDALVATSNNGLFVMEQATVGVSVRAGTGKYASAQCLDDLSPKLADAVRDAIARDRPGRVADDMIAVPLSTRDGDRGCILVEGTGIQPYCEELCVIYAGIVVQALENITLYQRATHDALCGIWNRSAGTQRLREALELGHRNGTETAVVLVDVDHFKSVNDRWGHAAGDLALVTIAAALADVCRDTDAVCRYGGEEFLLVLPSTGARGALHVAEKLRARIAGLQMIFEGSRIELTASFGVAVAAPLAYAPYVADELVRRADGALYQAKAAGRDRVETAGSLAS